MNLQEELTAICKKYKIKKKAREKLRKLVIKSYVRGTHVTHEILKNKL